MIIEMFFYISLGKFLRKILKHSLEKYSLKDAEIKEFK